MKIKDWCERKYGMSSWIWPCIFLSLYIILDWNVASYGGYALLAGMIPVAQIHFIFYVLSILMLILASLYLIVIRKFIFLILYSFFVIFFIYHLNLERDELIARAQRDSYNALQVMLKFPEKENVSFENISLEKKLQSIKVGARNELILITSSPLFHTYAYNIKSDDALLLNIQVSMLRNGNKFIVSLPIDNTRP